MANNIEQDPVRETLQGIARQRDDLLGDVEPIADERLAALRKTLVRAFPLEAAFEKMAEERDRSLVPYQSTIPSAVAQSLWRSISAAARSAREERRPWNFDWQSSARRWLLLHWPQRRTVCAVALMIAAAIVQLSNSKSREPVQVTADGVQSSRSAEPGLPTEAQRALLPRNQLNLRINAAELASLRASFLALNHTYWAEPSDEASAVRLDLPLRSLLLSDLAARTP